VNVVRKNFALKVLSLTLAIIGWAYFRLAGNPIVATSQDQQLSVPITAVNLPIGYVARFVDRQAVVTVETKRGDPPIKPEEIKAVLDLTNKGAGVYNVPVALVAPDLAVQSLSPASVTLTIERIETRPFAISVHYVGPQSSGIVVSQAAIRPDTALVRGPTSVLAQIASVRADVAMPNQPKMLDEMIRPVAVDGSGTEIADLSVTPNLVRVSIDFIAGAIGAK
jgi:YbbR domain-containing protein